MSGFVYIYDKSKGGVDHWGMINILEGGNYGDRFGSSVSIHEDTIVIGSDGFNDGNGAVYIYRRRVYNSEDLVYPKQHHHSIKYLVRVGFRNWTIHIVKLFKSYQ